MLKIALGIAGELRWVVKHGTYNLSEITFDVAFLRLGIALASVIDRGNS